MKPDYNNMTRTELKNYLLKHRQDEEGWSVFFEKLAEEDKQADFYPPPWEMKSEEFEAVLRAKVAHEQD